MRFLEKNEANSYKLQNVLKKYELLLIDVNYSAKHWVVARKIIQFL